MMNLLIRMLIRLRVRAGEDAVGHTIRQNWAQAELASSRSIIQLMTTLSITRSPFSTNIAHTGRCTPVKRGRNHLLFGWSELVGDEQSDPLTGR